MSAALPLDPIAGRDQAATAWQTLRAVNARRVARAGSYGSKLLGPGFAFSRAAPVAVQRRSDVTKPREATL